jgi:hypothetical protein
MGVREDTYEVEDSEVADFYVSMLLSQPQMVIDNSLWPNPPWQVSKIHCTIVQKMFVSNPTSGYGWGL